MRQSHCLVPSAIGCRNQTARTTAARPVVASCGCHDQLAILIVHQASIRGTLTSGPPQVQFSVQFGCQFRTWRSATVGGAEQYTEFCTGTRGTHWLPPAASLGEGTTQWVQDDRQSGTGQFWSARCQWLMCRGLVKLSCLPLLVLLRGVSMQWFQPIQQCDRCQAGSGTMQAQCTLAYMPQTGEATMCSGSSPVNVVNVAVLQQVCNMSRMRYVGHMCKMRPEPQNNFCWVENPSDLFRRYSSGRKSAWEVENPSDLFRSKLHPK